MAFTHVRSPEHSLFSIGALAGLMGGMAEEVRLGALERSTGAQVSVEETIEPVGACVASWAGAVFVKGSRRYQLERAVGGAQGTATH